MIRYRKASPGERSEKWPRRFLDQAEPLWNALGATIAALEHIGSTAVVGLPAKPIIDLAARVGVGVDEFSLGPAIADLGYELHCSGPKNHAVYVRGTSAGRTSILHAFAEADWQNSNQRIFRDKLLHDAAARQSYADLKITLADSGIAKWGSITAGSIEKCALASPQKVTCSE